MLFTAAATGAAPSWAQSDAPGLSAASEDQQGLGDIVVTAQKRPERNQDVPIAIKALSGATLANAQVHLAGDIIRFVPNLGADTIDAHVKPKWFLRSVGASSAANYIVSPVALYIDDVYINSTDAAGGPLFDLEAVDVLYGPQGTLWGKNSTGGAVSFVTRKPSFSAQGNLAATVGDHGQYVLDGAYGGPLIGDKLAFRAAGHVEGGHGFTRNSVTGKRVDDYDDNAIRLQLFGRLSDNWTALLSGGWRKFNGPALSSHIVSTLPSGANSFGYVVPTDRDTVGINAPYDEWAKNRNATLTLNGSVGSLQLTSVSAWNGFDYRSTADSDGSPLELGVSATSGARSFNRHSADQISQEIRLASPRSDRFNWIVGAHYFREVLKVNLTSATLPNTLTATSFSNTDYRLTSRSYAAFASATYNLTDALSLTAGVRETIERKSLDDTTVTGTGKVAFGNETLWWLRSSVSSTLATRADVDLAKTWRSPTYDATLKYELSKKAQIYARYAKGFRSGNYNAEATTTAAISVVKPEYLVDYEIGAKTEWLDNRLRVNASLFHYDYKDMQVNSVVAGQSNLLTNAATGKVDGGELQIDALPLRQWEVSANFGYSNNRFSSFPYSATVDLTGYHFQRSPEFSTTLSTQYTAKLPASDNAIVFATDWSYRSREYFNLTNQTDPRLIQNGYWLGNAEIALTLARPQLRLSVYVRNIANTRFRSSGLPGNYGVATAYLGDPRTVGLSLRKEF
ncbi:TonB-dependent receptor [Sphingomonas crusticola]|uniref:TonB-dependent receptor n=1 Tax=Sphingomonas crusticola TaxID=1697973 RepID=UPI0013C3093D|nr:TonB-dependent receptor [Sphingomonas crusticola]